MLIIYGILFIIIENKNKSPKVDDLANISFKMAFGIGIFQMLALIPGTSRSGATIVGSLLLGLSRYTASEFSFFLAIPAMVVASGFKLIKAGLAFSNLELMILLVGSITAFIVSLWVIRFLLGYIRKHNFKIFGYYRIALGLLILLFYFFV
jgi:undecaprenyl-diphosphatase